MYKFLPILVVIVLFAFTIAYLPLRRELAYRLGISGDTTTSCCNEEEVTSTSGEFDDEAEVAIFNGEFINYPKTSLAQGNFNNNSSTVLGTTNAAGEEKWIEVSLDEQMLRAWEGNKQIMEFPISSGKWAPTPKGTFNIWYKTRNQVMSGGSKELGTYYYLPNVPHNMFFYKGYAIHGAYWHNNFGQPMSHGCVNSPLDKIGALFDWAGPTVPAGENVARAIPENPGTRVLVH
ncbi:L,D-transpeptidase [Candidatus Daviesbacteria bacterium]|nr:L,D-transpeptidase [Candidatus Daviesbacteria bacterium]